MRILILSLFVFYFQAQGKMLVVADVDNTIKRTGGKDLKRIVLKKLRKEDRPYITLKNLFQNLYLNESARFFYLSLSFEEISPVKSWLVEHQFPPGKTVQRTVNSLADSKKYKKQKLTEYLSKKDLKDATVLFWGDNQEYDPEVYVEVAQELGLRDYKIYIRDQTTHDTYWGMDAFIRPNFKINTFLRDADLFDLSRFPEFFGQLNYFVGPTKAIADQEVGFYPRLGNKLSMKLFYAYCLEDRSAYCVNKVKLRTRKLLLEKGIKR